MQELEVKILEIDKNKIIEKLESLNAVKVFDGSIEAEFYFINGKKIRLRKMWNKNRFNCKKWVAEWVKFFNIGEIKLV